MADQEYVETLEGVVAECIRVQTGKDLRLSIKKEYEAWKKGPTARSFLNWLADATEADACYFCTEPFRRDRHGEYAEEVGEIVSRHLLPPARTEGSVLTHPDCVDWEGITLGEDPDWKLA